MDVGGGVVGSEAVGGMVVGGGVASYPGPFEKLEKRARYPLFMHALN